MREILVGYADALEEQLSASHASELRGDVESFLTALMHHDDLRRAFTDPAIALPTRRSILRDLLEGKARPEAIDLLSFTVAVERPPELPSVLGQLLAKLDEDAAGGVGPDSVADEPATRIAGRERLRGFAGRVLQEISTAAKVDEVEDELFRLARIIDDHRELRVVLADPEAPLAARLEVLHDLLSQKVRPETLRLASYVLAAGQQRDLVGVIEGLAVLAAEERGRRLAEVRSAVELDEDEQERLAAALARVVERPVEIRVILDPSVVGGVFVTVGDLVIDGTVRLRLERLRDALAPSS